MNRLLTPSVKQHFIFLIFVSFVFSNPVIASNSETPPQSAIASAHPLATQAGIKILQQGGNAFDAAITVASVLAVVEPYSSGFGGGGFWLIHDAKQQRNVFIDGRETAPQKAHPKLYQNNQNEVIRSLSINGPLAAGIPGQAAALAHLAKHYGNLPLSTTLSDAIHYAEQGFPVDKVYRKLAAYRLKAMQEERTTNAIFLVDGKIPELDHLIKQPALAQTLKRLAKAGHTGFYQGETAQYLVKNMTDHGGIWTLEDLANYQVIERAPIEFDYQGYHFISAPPPSAGGIALAQMFGMLQHHTMPQHQSVEQIQLLAEVMRRAYRDRAEYLGDPAFTDIPSKLTSSSYLQQLSNSITPNKATPSSELKPVLPPNQGTDTTHYSILDDQGNRVSATLSINLPFGSAYTDPDTGLLLNNEMDDFSSQPGVPNSYGLVATEANAVEAGKRPLSSMTPTFIESPDSLAILGTPGGSRIITMVFLGALEHLNQAPVENWVSRPRFHHQYLPDVIQHEPETFSSAEKKQLERHGYKLKPVGRTYGNMQAILWNLKEKKVTAASDPRRIGNSLTLNH
ncbi:gamma-glutamyltransferase [Litoribrevibacter euphylliae]|uniref:Glutathione hydrolase proenzyme n=1 Tax=Litoribrevibacter euphylliae TaxID=1834034 RepID=A0ABV7HIQ6_9GAMM